MSDTFTLNPGESVIKRNPEVGLGKGPFNRQNNELILTNQSLILQKKNFFGGNEEVVRYPLSDIVISNGQAQVRVGQLDNVTHTLDVYLTGGMVSFVFTWEQEIKEWANEINAIVTGGPAIYEKTDLMSEMAGMMEMAEKLTGTGKNVRKAFGIQSTEAASARCPGCGASITGVEGQTIKCPYCGTYYTF